MQLRRIIPEGKGGQNVEKHIHHCHGKRYGQSGHSPEGEHSEKADGIGEPVGENTLIALDDKFLYICRAVRLCQSPLAEAAEAAKLPYFVLPAPDLQSFIKLLLGL